MTLPNSLNDLSLPIKYFLSSYRALSDARNGIERLDKLIAGDRLLVSEWKIAWIGCCAILRTCIDLFDKVDSRSCIHEGLRKSIRVEWNEIKNNSAHHPIFWQFLRKERDNIIHEYRWTAYEAWLHPDGTLEPRLSLLSFELGRKPVVAMRDGHFKGRDSVELLHEAADWVQDRIYSAIGRAGLDPDDERRIYDFTEPSPIEPGSATLLSGVLTIPGRESS